MSDFNSNSVGYIDCYLGYGWGYIGRGLKGGFKFKSWNKKKWQEDLYIDSKSGQEVWTESLDRKSMQNISKKYVRKMTWKSIPCLRRESGQKVWAKYARKMT